MPLAPSADRTASARWLALVVCVVAAFVAVHFRHAPDAPPGISSNNSDAWQYHLAVREYGFDRLRAGQLPLWNPYILGGQPFLATHQAAVLYPLNFPHWFLDHGLALGVVMALHILWASIGIYLWLRYLEHPPYACALGALVFGLAPTVVNPLQWPHVLLGNAWLPWICWGIDAVADRPTARRGALLALACTSLLLSGYIQGAVYIYYAALPYAALRWWQTRAAQAPRRALWFVLGLGVLPFFASALQLWPLLELVQHSARSAEGIDPRAVATLGYIPGAQIWRSLIGAWQPNAILFGPGVLAWLLVALGCTLPMKGRLVFWLVVGAGAAVLATGFDTPLYRIYYHLPTGATFRLPVRLLLLTACAAGVLVADGATRLGTQKRNLSSSIFIVLLVVGMLLTAVSRAWVLGGLGVVCVLAWCLRPTWTPAVALLSALVLGAGAIRGYSYTATLPWHGPAPFADDHLLRAYLDTHLDHQRIHIYRTHGDWKHWRYAANWGMGARVRQLTGYESLPLASTAAAFAAIDRNQAAESGIPFVGGLELTNASAHPDLLRLWSIKYLIVDEGFSGGGATLALPDDWQPDADASTATGLRILRNPHALPRTYFSVSAPPDAQPSSLNDVVTNGIVDGVTFLQDDPERVQLQLDAAEDGYVVLHDAWYPGWEAKVDGVITPIRKAYGLFRAVRVAAGAHTVEFVYRPATARFGLLSSLLGLGVILLCIARHSGPR